MAPVEKRLTPRTLRYAVTRMGFLAPTAVGVALLAASTDNLTAGFIVLGVGLLNLWRYARRRGLHGELLFQDDKRRHGIRRSLKMAERREMDAVVEYCRRLRAQDLDPELAQQTLTHAWEILRTAPGQNGSQQLAAFRAELPPLDEGQSLSQLRGALSENIRREISRQRKIESELDAL